MAAVLKEHSSHLDDGARAIFSSWSLYLLIAAGAATMLLASHALAAGPLAASQPGFTILDPLTPSLLGMFLFGEHIRTGGADLAGEALALAAVIGAAAVLSHSCHIAGENSHPSHPVMPSVAANTPAAAGGRRAARAGGAGRVLSGVRLSSAGTATTTWPRHRDRPGSTSPERVLSSRSRSRAAASGTTTWPSPRTPAGWPRCPPSRAGVARAPVAAGTRAARVSRTQVTHTCRFTQLADDKHLPRLPAIRGSCRRPLTARAAAAAPRPARVPGTRQPQ